MEEVTSHVTKEQFNELVETITSSIVNDGEGINYFWGILKDSEKDSLLNKETLQDLDSYYLNYEELEEGWNEDNDEYYAQFKYEVKGVSSSWFVSENELESEIKEEVINILERYIDIIGEEKES